METNIVSVSVDNALQDVVEKLRQQDVKALPYGSKRIRLVTHGGIDDDGLARTVQAFKMIAETE